MARQRQQSPRALLRDHPRGAEAARRRGCRVAAVVRCREPRARLRLPRWMTMTWYHEVATRLSALFGRRSHDREMSEELQFHIEMETRRNLENGLSASEARRRALRDFGGV